MTTPTRVIPATAHIHNWIADGEEWSCAVDDCEQRYPKGWTVGDKPTVATTAALVTSVRDFREAERGVADAMKALRAAQRHLSRQRHAMHAAGAAAGVDNAVPSRRWGDVIEWVRRTDES
jgi:hypothetical protein